MRANYLVIVLLLCAAAFLSHSPRELVVPQARSLQTFPSVLGSWIMSSNTVFDEATLKVLRPADYLSRTYVDKEGRRIGLYVGYHSGGPGTGPIHSPRNCLPGSGWYSAGSGELSLAADGTTGSAGRPLRIVRTVYAKGEQEVVYFYWYQIRGDTLTSDVDLKLAELKGVLLDRRKDAAFIRIDMDKALPDEQINSLAFDFIRTLEPVLREYLPS